MIHHLLQSDTVTATVIGGATTVFGWGLNAAVEEPLPWIAQLGIGSVVAGAIWLMLRRSDKLQDEHEAALKELNEQLHKAKDEQIAQLKADLQDARRHDRRWSGETDDDH